MLWRAKYPGGLEKVEQKPTFPAYSVRQIKGGE